MSSDSEQRAESAPEPKYVPPQVMFHSREEVLRRAGPAIGCARWSVTGDSSRAKQYRG